MYAHSVLRLAIGVFAFCLPGFAAMSAMAQTPTGDGQPHVHGAPDEPAAQAQEPSHQHDMHTMSHDPAQMAGNREGSGTAWLPDETPMHAIHTQAGGWTLMAHGSAFLEYLHEDGTRGSSQTGSINWLMGMADRPLGGGHLGLRGMFTLEPWTIRGCGYPDLLATGEICQGESIHDRQHPHDLVMELAAEYDRSIGRGIRFQLYGGPVGEPALGPVAFPHRLSALPNPLAPISHHWLDATHLAYGVVTGGVYSARWKAETSIFNGREPDEHRTNLETGALDSWSARLWFLPTRRWALQLSGARVKAAEPGRDGEGKIDIDRLTASATYHRAVQPGSLWASTLAWGRNSESGAPATDTLLAETNLTVGERHSWFGRFEVSEKPDHDLGLDGSEALSVGKVQAGYVRYFAARHDLRPGVGATVSAGVVPDSLREVYGGRFNAGFGVFLTVRTTEHRGQ